MTEISDTKLAFELILVFISGILFGFIIDQLPLFRKIIKKQNKENVSHE